MSGTSIPSSLQSQSPVPQLPQPLPPPGPHVYHPPMLQDGPPHLNLETRHLDTTLMAACAPTQLSHQMDRNCKVPMHDTTCDTSSCNSWTFSNTAVGTDSNTLENLSEIPGKSSEIPNTTNHTSDVSSHDLWTWP